VQITLRVTGTRLINAMNALVTAPTGGDADVIAVVKEAAILIGFGSARPSVQTDGNFTAAGGDVYRVDDLFRGKAPIGQTIAGYRVALGAGDGKLLLDGVAVPGRTSFTAEEFNHLTYTTGTGQQDLVVVAQTGTRQPDGGLIHVTDSQAVQITASVTGTRSINALNALVGMPTDADAAVAEVVKEAAILSGFGAARPSVQTDGNFSAIPAIFIAWMTCSAPRHPRARRSPATASRWGAATVCCCWTVLAWPAAPASPRMNSRGSRIRLAPIRHSEWSWSRRPARGSEMAP
jgi:hypothetical protein